MQRIHESILDVERKTFAQNIFDRANTEKPVLKKHIIRQIEKQISDFERVAPVVRYRMIGGIITKNYNDESDLDINVLFDVPRAHREVVHKKLREMALNVNGRNATGTTHPINYYVIVDPFVYAEANSTADNVYDISTGEFEK